MTQDFDCVLNTLQQHFRLIRPCLFSGMSQPQRQINKRFRDVPFSQSVHHDIFQPPRLISCLTLNVIPAPSTALICS